MDEKDSSHIKPYTRPAAGWGALKQVAITLHQERVAPANLKALLAQNQPDGFDCPGCAWPDSNHQSTFAFCENGAKAVAEEGTTLRVGLHTRIAVTPCAVSAWRLNFNARVESAASREKSTACGYAC